MNQSMKLMLACFFLSISVLAAPICAQSNSVQSAAGSASSSLGKSADCLEGAVSDLRARYNDNVDRPSMVAAVTKTMTPYICYAASEPVRAKMLADYEESRLDKQPGATSNSSGSTSLVSKGSSPSLLGFALEHGGLTQTTSGNTITFRGNIANSVSALLKSTYLESYDLSQKDALFRSLSRLSFGVSFDSSANQPSTTQGFEPSGSNFSGFSAKYEVYNHRDPRDSRWTAKWNGLSGTIGLDVANSIGELEAQVKTSRNDVYARWVKTTEDAINALPQQGASDDDFRKILRDAANSFTKLFSNVPEIQGVLSQASSRITQYLDQEKSIVGQIRKTPMLTVEYNLSRQLTSNSQSITATQTNQKIPDLSNVNLVLERGFSGANAPELTFNASGTWFNSTDTSSPNRGRIRDFSASVQLDVPLKEIQNIGQPTLTFSGKFLALVNEPLGQQVMINGVTVTRTGNMGVFQTKISIPVKGSGVRIPISFTYASRTELVKESDVRGNIGITFDLDSLFSKK